MSYPSSSQFVPPQSAQPYVSIFGGSSSQNAPDPEQPVQATEDGYSDDGLDAVIEDQFLGQAGSDDDDTYEESGGDGSSSEDGIGTRSTRHGSRKRKSASITTTESQKFVESSPPGSPLYRPNRFRGPEATWRKLTLEDRHNAEALEDIRAKDLAAHLYNSYALRARARKLARRDAEIGIERDETRAFLPPKRWAAWPMPADEVPRGDELRGDDEEWTLKMPADPRPSADLEESIMAVMLKVAKDRFNARLWDDMMPSAANTVETTSQKEGTAAEDMKSEPDSLDDLIPQRPVIQADDDQSRRQLRPITRNIITEFDRLLMGLHHARKGLVAGDESSASEWQTDTESIVSGSSVSVRRKRRSNNETSRSHSRGRKRTRRSSVRATSAGPRSRSTHASRRASSASLSSHRRRSISRGRSIGSDRTKSRNKMRLGLRDWSEVLGVASMLGWPPAVVMRTAQRCAALFGEDMAYRTFKEGKLQQTGEGDAPTWEYAETDTDASEASLGSLSILKQPHSRAASTREESTSRPSSMGPEGRPNVERPRGKGEHRKADLICPLRSCSRHTKGFSRRWNLNLHMKRMHPGYVPRDTGNRPPAVSVDDDDMDDE
ncbi:RNA polymerase I-specific transcription initiation factor-domain-containing protein [Aspergillus ambiguus]|uniref:uncharacterized protein n=1 Tax=Aspergillus ambiguus TaxID=176160 RepID=UPI003CCE23C0